jgi:hypothetical protein
MTPIEFVLWLNGAAELVGDQPPTPEQWATMREKLGEAVGGLVASRLLERAEETLRDEERRKKEGVAKAEVAMLRLAEYQARMERYKAQVDFEAQKALGWAHAAPAGTIFEAPETPKPRSPGFLNLIFGRTTT